MPFITFTTFNLFLSLWQITKSVSSLHEAAEISLSPDGTDIKLGVVGSSRNSLLSFSLFLFSTYSSCCVQC